MGTFLSLSFSSLNLRCFMGILLRLDFLVNVWRDGFCFIVNFDFCLFVF